MFVGCLDINPIKGTVKRCDCNHNKSNFQLLCSSCDNLNDKEEDYYSPMDLAAPAVYTTTSSSMKGVARRSDTKGNSKFEMKWTVDLDPGWLPDNKKTLQLCRESFSFLYGFSPNLIKKTSKKIKDIMSADLSSIKTEAQYNHRSYFGDDFTIDDIQKLFDANGLESDYSERRAALLRASNIHIDSMVWMEEYFYQYESQPNANQIHIDATFKRTIWQEYCKAPLPSTGRLSEVVMLILKYILLLSASLNYFV